MRIVNVKQGSEAWLAHRATTRNSSDAPAMMGVSPYVTRTELVRQYATGIQREIDDATQALFDNGHKVEPILRAVAEQIIGEDLYPITATSNDGYLGASFDGVTLDDSVIFEAKQQNALKLAAIGEGRIPLVDHWQIVQQFAVNESAQRCIYVCGDGAGALHLWIERAQIEDDIPKLRAGWEQFDADVAAYQDVVQPAAPTAVGRAPDTLPALRIELTGMVTASNLGEFKSQALAVLGSINRDLKTDEDFADAEKTVKWCSDVESRIAAAKQHALSQTVSIDELFRTLDDVSAETRRIRLELDKLVKAEKESRKSEIVSAGIDAVRAHYKTINSTLGEHEILAPQSLSLDIGGSIKGLKTLSSIKDAVATAVANAKIAASQRADAVRASVAALTETMAGHETLFADRVALCASKAPDDIRNLVAARIADHKQREAAKQEAERERVRKQEEAARIQAENKTAVEVRAGDVTGTPAPVAQLVEHDPSKFGATGSSPVGRSTARVKLGDICAAIAPLTITATGLSQLGFESVGTDRAAKLYAADDLPRIFGRLANLIVEAAKRDVKARAAA